METFCFFLVLRYEFKSKCCQARGGANLLLGRFSLMKKIGPEELAPCAPINVNAFKR